MTRVGHYFLVLTLITSTAGDVVKRSDDSSPLEVAVSSQAQEISNLKARVGVLENLAGRKVALHARHPPNPLVPNTPIKFVPDAQTGGGYDTVSGIFTAPFAGWYSILYNLMTHDAANIYLDTMVNSVITHRLMCRVPAEATCHSGFLLHLHEGDRVWLQTSFHGSLWDSDYDNMLSIVMVIAD